MFEKLRVVFKVSETSSAPAGLGQRTKTIFEYTGETVIPRECLAGILSEIITGDMWKASATQAEQSPVSEDENPFDDERFTHIFDDLLTPEVEEEIAETMLDTGVLGVTVAKKPRKSPTPTISMVCEKCGRRFLAHTSRQKQCHRPDCAKTAAAKVRDRELHPDKPRRAPLTPRIAAICEHCGNPFMAFTKRQRVCTSPECERWLRRQFPSSKQKAAERLNVSVPESSNPGNVGWKPSIVIDTDRGVIKGSALVTID